MANVVEPDDAVWLIRGITPAGYMDGIFPSSFWRFEDNGMSVWAISAEAIQIILDLNPAPVYLQALTAGACRRCGGPVSNTDSGIPNAPGGHAEILLKGVGKSERERVAKRLRDEASKISIPVSQDATAQELHQQLSYLISQVPADGV